LAVVDVLFRIVDDFPIVLTVMKSNALSEILDCLTNKVVEPLYVIAGTRPLPVRPGAGTSFKDFRPSVTAPAP